MLKENILYKDGLSVNGYVADIKAWPVHFHDDMELIYILKGTVHVKNVHYTYTLNEGDVFILNDKELHSFSSDGKPNMVLTMQFDLTCFENYFPEIRNSFFVTDLSGKADARIEKIKSKMARIMFEMMKPEETSGENVLEFSKQVIGQLVDDFRYFALEKGKFVEGCGNKRNAILADRLYNITKYIYENYKEKITLAEVAENEHLSTYYLSHIIKEFTGLGFQEFVSFARVEESEKLLLGTDKSISAIAEACGFSAVRYYIKFFEKWFKMHPTQYRKQYKDKEHQRESNLLYDLYDEKTILEVLSKKHGPFTSGGKRGLPGAVFLASVDTSCENKVDIDEISTGKNLYCYVEDMEDYPAEVMQICKELSITVLVVKIGISRFNFHGVDTLHEMGIQLIFEILLKDGDGKVVAGKLKKRYGESTNIVMAERDTDAEILDYGCDSILMLPQVIQMLFHKKEIPRKFSMVDGEKSTALVSGQNGLLNSMLLKKPAYYGYKMVSDLVKGTLIHIGKGYAVSKIGEDFRVLVYCEPKTQSIYHNPESAVKEVLEDNDQYEYVIKLENVMGEYTIQSYEYAEGNSTMGVHAKLNYPQVLSKEDEMLCKWAVSPGVNFFKAEAFGTLHISGKVSKNAALFYFINKG